MPSGRPKQINEYFFEDPNINDRIKEYVWGISCGCYIPVGEKGVRFTSKHRELIELVKELLNSKHTIIDIPQRNSHWIEVKNSYLRYSLEKRLVKDKSKREFPENIEEKSLSHFVRGFFDGQAYIHRIDGGATRIDISYRENTEFLRKLHFVLKDRADVQRQSSGEKLGYGHADSMRIYVFLYEDWEFIKEKGIYLPAKRDRFNTEHELINPGERNWEEAELKIKRARLLLLEDLTCKDTAEEVGYESYDGFYGAFKRHTKGINPRKWLKLERAKELLADGVDPEEVGELTGVRIQTSFSEDFKEYTGLYPEEWQKKHKE